MKIAGLERFIPNKKNNWSSVIMNNKRLHLSIVSMWKQCVPQECCPKWVMVNPYEPNISTGSAVFRLLVEYNRRNRDKEIWKEAINLANEHVMSKGPKELWDQITRVSQKAFSNQEYHNDNIISQALQQMIVENLAARYDRIKEEFIRNKDMEFTLALKLLRYEAEESTTSKRTDNRREDKDIMLSSGTTVALIPNKHLLYSFTEGPKTALLVRGLKEIPVTGEGIFKINFNEKITIEMAAMVVPSVKMVIIPLKSLYKNNLHVSENGNSIKSRNDEILTPIFEKNELWWISDDHIQVPSKEYQVDQLTKPKKHRITLRDLHWRLGHTDVRCIRETIKRGGIEDSSISDVDWKGIDDFQCESCMKGKASRHARMR